MIYKKLPVVFLSALSSEKHNSTNSIIAAYILEHLDDVKNMGIAEIASHAHVANSSVSRFVKEIGLRDFAELKEMLNQSNQFFEQAEGNYVDEVVEGIRTTDMTLDIKKVDELCADILKYNKIATFGLLKSESVAMNFQIDLMMLGRNSYTNVSYKEQMDYILNASEDDLIIIFSYTASYFDATDLRADKKKLLKPKIWMVSGEVEDMPDYIDQTITFTSKENQINHPYALQYTAGVIAQRLAKMMK